MDGELVQQLMQEIRSIRETQVQTIEKLGEIDSRTVYIVKKLDATCDRLDNHEEKINKMKEEQARLNEVVQNHDSEIAELKESQKEIEKTISRHNSYFKAIGIIGAFIALCATVLGAISEFGQWLVGMLRGG